MRKRDCHYMNSGRLLLLIFFASLIAPVASGKNIKKTDQQFEQGLYYNALNGYLSLQERPSYSESGEITYRIGVCYLEMKAYEKAIEWLEKAESRKTEEKELYYMLGEAYLTTGNYAQAKELFMRYRKIVPNDKRIPNKIASCNLGLQAPTAKLDITIEPIAYLNTPGDESSILFMNEKILYASMENALSANRKDISPRTGKGFPKFYLSTLSDNEYQPGILLKGISGKTQENYFTYDSVQQLLYIQGKIGKMNYRVSMAQLKDQSSKKEHAFKVAKTGLYHTFTNYTIAHPFSADHGNRIYFSSTMPGGYGGSDIWYVDRLPDGTWKEPVNLGANINTAGDEVYPYLWNNMFYFASNGHAGYGGLDMYMSRYMDNTWSIVRNLGPGINTSYNDFNMIIHSDGTSGLLVSNRYPDMGNDIFRFDVKGIWNELRGVVKDNLMEERLFNVSITLSDEQEVLKKDAEDGTFMLMLKNGVRYRLTLNTPGYQKLTKNFIVKNNLLKPFWLEGEHVEQVYLLERAEIVEQPIAPQQEARTLKELLTEIHQNYSITHYTGEINRPGWWIQVAMLRESNMISHDLATQVTKFTDKEIISYTGADGGHRFYAGPYSTEEEARNVVLILKKAGIDCFVKNVPHHP